VENAPQPADKSDRDVSGAYVSKIEDILDINFATTKMDQTEKLLNLSKMRNQYIRKVLSLREKKIKGSVLDETIIKNEKK
jgi:hypothetical protein